MSDHGDAERLRTGRAEPVAELIRLRAGPLELTLDGPDLRYVAWEGHELVRRVYMAVRDLDWDTIPGVVVRREVAAYEDRFRVRMDLEHRSDDLALDWTLEADGTPEGIVEYVMRARAQSTFWFAKIGLNLHHPIEGLAGRRYAGTGASGPVRGRLPEHIHPQIHLNADHWDLPMFLPVQELELDHVSGRVRVEFRGDPYEMEDQRNWSDQSFKTSSMPAQLGYRHEIRAGAELLQRVRLSFTRAPAVVVRPRRPAAGPPTEGAARLEVGASTGRRVPPIGLGHTGVLADPSLGQVAALRPAHLRLDVDLGADRWEERLETELHACAQVGAAAELALFLADDPRETLPTVVRALRDAGVPVARVLVFRRDEETTPAAWVSLVRTELSWAAPVGGGVDTYFDELNRRLPDLRPFGVICWSINPQVHAFDERSLIENLEGQAEQVRSGRFFAGPTPIAISPVSLRPRFNAVATTGRSPSDPDALPANADPRQATLFGASWTLGSLAQLIRAGADSLTYFETVGPRGVVEGASAAPPPFASRAHQAFPLYHVLADAAGLAACDVLACSTPDEPWLAGLAVQQGDGQLVVLVANLLPFSRAVRLALPVESGSARVRVLDEESAVRASEDPAAFRRQDDWVDVVGSGLELALGAYATARVRVG